MVYLACNIVCMVYLACNIVCKVYLAYIQLQCDNLLLDQIPVCTLQVDQYAKDARFFGVVIFGNLYLLCNVIFLPDDFYFNNFALVDFYSNKLEINDTMFFIYNLISYHFWPC